MANSSLILLFFMATATISVVWGECDANRCNSIVPPTGIIGCGVYNKYHDCNINYIQNNAACDAVIKGDANQADIDVKERAGCGAASLVTSLVVTLGLSSLAYFFTSSE